jgi:hypothetical protein
VKRKASPKKRSPEVAQKRRPGRPSAYSDELADRILERMARGETLRAICNESGMPSASTVRLWSINDEPPGFSARYARAREFQADAIAEEALEIADTSDDPAKARLQVDTRKWLASKINPAKFADRQQLEHSGRGGGPVEFTFLLDRASDDSDDPDGAAEPG